MTSVEGALASFTTTEQLLPEYKCQHCTHAVRASKQLTLLNVPPVFVIHLKRCDFDFQLRTQSKISTHISFGETLDLCPFLTPEVGLGGGGHSSFCSRGRDVFGGLLHGCVASVIDVSDFSRTQSLAHAGSAPVAVFSSRAANDKLQQRLTQLREHQPARPAGAATTVAAQPGIALLYAVIVHDGISMDDGHYICYVRSLAVGREACDDSAAQQWCVARCLPARRCCVARCPLGEWVKPFDIWLVFDM